jgi:hypothetical protein
MAVGKDRAPWEQERKLFESYASERGYNLERARPDRLDVRTSLYKNSVVDSEWRGWQARALLATKLTGSSLDVVVTQGEDIDA